MSSLGLLKLSRHWWGSRCGCTPGGYAIDALLGIDSYCTRMVQQQLCAVGADLSFAKTREHVQGFWKVLLSSEVIRHICHGHGRQMSQWQPKEQQTPKAFAQAAGAVEFTVDAGKVNTREKGWKDLKIAAFQKRPAAKAASPEQWQTRDLPKPTACVAWADVQKSKTFRKSWRGWSRRLGVVQTCELHVLADGAKWIWKAVDHVFTGSQQTLDVYHACQHVAKAGERLYGEGSAESLNFLNQGRVLLLSSGWNGITQLVGQELQKEDTPVRRRALEKLLNYFAQHVGRVGYRQRLHAGQAIGSGAVEGWAKTLALRLKARGARWKCRNVKGMAALGCVRNSSQWAAYWAPQKST
jgi:hypothetical protein